MKGLTHLMAGVAWASCWPAAVSAGAAGHPGLFILGAACGILPDTLDFRVIRYLYPHEMEIIPDPRRPDPQLIARALATAIARARGDGKPFRVRLHTARVAAGLWHQYRLRFDVAAQRIHVDFTGTVNTSREARPASSADSAPSSASAALPCAIALDYRAAFDVDIFDGPTFGFDPMADGRVRVRFIPWHRQCTHSLVVAAGVGAAAWGLGGATAGAVAAGAWALHVLADQTGFMGSNLWFPFTRRRTPGYQLAEADNPWVNATVVASAIVLVFWNLARLASPPVAGLSLVTLGLGAVVLPVGIAAFVARRLRRSEFSRT